MRSWSLMMVLFLVACPPPCDKSNCVGCCDATGECNGGANRRACGKNGALCSVCGTDERCVTGRCVVAGDAGVMADADGGVEVPCERGCRDQSLLCHPGNLPEACGADGGTCVACAASQRCDTGRCVSGICTGCVDPVGNCQLGGDSFNCGQGGALCRTCLPQERCMAQACVLVACSPTTCQTCCQGSICVNSTNQTCGRNGVACVACSAGKACVSGMCR